MEWRPILGWESWYEVSDAGDVRRIAPSTRHPGPHVLKPSPNGKQYFQVRLRRPGFRQMKCVHLLVASAFLPTPKPDEIECDHINGVKSDNSVGNLEWVTPGENMRRAYAKGLTSKAGELNGRAKLTWEKVAEIRGRAGTNVALAAEYGVSDAVISDIRSGRSWEVPPPGRTIWKR